MGKTNKKSSNGSIYPSSSSKGSYKQTLNENKATYGYRPSGPSSSDELVSPDCESSVQNVNKNS